MGQSRPLFVYFRPFLITISIIQIEKSVDGVLGIRTQGRRMVGTDETTELCFRLFNAVNKVNSKQMIYKIVDDTGSYSLCKLWSSHRPDLLDLKFLQTTEALTNFRCCKNAEVEIILACSSNLDISCSL